MVEEEGKELTNVAIDYAAHVSETLADMMRKDGLILIVKFRSLWLCLSGE